MDYVVALLQGRESWVAGSDEADEGVSRHSAAGPEFGQTFFVNGEPIGFNGFDFGEPSGGTSENVLHMFGGQWWNDVDPTYPNISGFMVEFSVLSGDFNYDGTVDAADYVAWQKGLIASTPSNYDVWRSSLSSNQQRRIRGECEFHHSGTDGANADDDCSSYLVSPAKSYRAANARISLTDERLNRPNSTEE